MPLFWTEERVSKSGARLPFTTVQAAGLTLGFHGRFGPHLKAAAQRLEDYHREGGESDGANAPAARAEGS